MARGLDDPRRGAPRGHLRRALLRSCGRRPRARERVKFDEPELTHAFADPLLAPLARWDAAWYLRIADSGYGDSEPRAAFFPLYPLLVRSLGALGGGSPAALLVASYLIALAAFVVALTLLYRLVSLELGRRLAPPTLLLLAVFPAAVFFGAPYSESLFLALAVGGFYAARTGHWAWAGVCAMGASATRSAGLLLLIPLAMLWWSSRERGVRATPPGSCSAPSVSPPTPPGSASWRATRCASSTSRTPGRASSRSRSRRPGTASRRPSTACASSPRARAARSTSSSPAGDPFRIAAINIMLFATLVFALVAFVGRVAAAAEGIRCLGGRVAPAAAVVPGQARSR